MVLPDPLRLAIALLPLASYGLLIGLLNARRQPFLTSGGADMAALGAAMSGLVLVGPIELFRPEAASAEYGSYVWLFLLVLYWLGVWLTVLLARPRLVIYNITAEQLRPVLAAAAREIEPQARWAGDGLALPTLGIQLHLESFDFMRNVAIVSSGGRQNLEGWRRLGYELYARLGQLQVRSNPRSPGILLLSLLLWVVCLAQLVTSPQLVVQALREIFTY